MKLRKIHNAGLGHSGVVDSLGAVAGRMLVVEFKRKGKGTPPGRETDPGGWDLSSATDAQKEDLRGWLAVGAVAAVIDDRGIFRLLVEGVLHDGGWCKGPGGRWLLSDRAA